MKIKKKFLSLGDFDHFFQESNRLKMVEIRENALDNEKELRSLDSTLKKTTSFMKKIKILSAASVPQLIEELNKLNLSKFVEEMASVRRRFINWKRILETIFFSIRNNF